jgi:hypothetical protein
VQPFLGPVVYLAHVLKPDYSDAAFPYWRLRMEPASGNRAHCMERTMARIFADVKTSDEVIRMRPAEKNLPARLQRHFGEHRCVDIIRE